MEAVNYSAEFRRLTSEATELVALLAGSDVTTDVGPAEAFAAWEASRHFIASVISDGGSVLDYGCGNGFLLRCLQEWCPHSLEPFGVDIDPARLDRARALFAPATRRFTLPEEISSMGMPDGFDFVYWAVGDNLDFTAPENLRWLHSISKLVGPGGRLIVGFYDTTAENVRRISDIERSGFRFTGILTNPRGPEMIAWLDRKSTEHRSTD